MARRTTLDLLLEPRMAALAEALPQALAGEPAGVHQARVASRRLREVVPVMTALGRPTARRARASLRRITRAFGPVREHDVCAMVYSELTADTPVHALADTAMRRALAAARAAAQRSACRRWPTRRLDRLWTDLDAMSAGTSDESIDAVGAAVAARIAKRIHGMRAAIEGLGVLYAPDRLHAVRIAVKQWRYTLEIAGELRRGRTPAALGLLRTMQEQLGRAHDLHVLAERVRAVETRVVARSRPAARDLRRLARRIDDSCRALHAAFLLQRASILDLAAARSTAARASRARTAA